MFVLTCLEHILNVLMENGGMPASSVSHKHHQDEWREVDTGRKQGQFHFTEMISSLLESFMSFIIIVLESIKYDAKK